MVNGWIQALEGERLGGKKQILELRYVDWCMAMGMNGEDLRVKC